MNGLALVKNGKIKFIKKGVKYSNKEIAKKMLKEDYDYAFYHTRVASVSSINDNNCHPYWDKKKTSFLMMNGTESEFGSIAKAIGITDTELIYMNMLAYNVSPSALQGMSSRFMGLNNKKVFIVNSSYSGLKFIKEKNAFVVASTFPDWVKCSDMAVGVWQQGEKIREKTITNIPSYGSSYRSQSWQYKSAKDEEIDEIRQSAKIIDLDDRFVDSESYLGEYDWERYKYEEELKNIK